MRDEVMATGVKNMVAFNYRFVPAIRQIRRDSAKTDYQFSALVNAIVSSVPFQMRRTPER